MGRPRLIYKNKDLSQIVQSSDSPTLLGICGGAKWGPVYNPDVDDVPPFTLVGGSEQAVQLFGEPSLDTPLIYQLLSWFKLGSSVYVLRPQGDSLYGGVNAEKGSEIQVLSSEVSTLADKLSSDGSKVVAIYTKYPGEHSEGDIYINILSVDDTTGTFSIEVGTKVIDGGTSIDTADPYYEYHDVSVVENSKDEMGRSLYIQDVLDKDSILITGRAIENADVDDVPAESSNPITLGGQVFYKPTVGQMETAMEAFKMKDAVDIDLMILGDYFDEQTIVSKLTEVVEDRGDSFAIYAPDINADWTLNGIKDPSAGWKSTLPDTWQAAPYAIYYKFYDVYNDKYVYINAAGALAAGYSNNDNIAEQWYAPAGSPRGVQQGVEPAKKWKTGEQDALYDEGINFVINNPSGGLTMEGIRTNYSKSSSAYSKVNVARLLLRIRKDLTPFLSDFMYEFNNETTRELIENGITDYLEGLEGRQALYDSLVVCSGGDEGNNPPSVIDQGKLIVDVYLKPSKAIEWLYLRTIVTSTGINFEDIA